MSLIFEGILYYSSIKVHSSISTHSPTSSYLLLSLLSTYSLWKYYYLIIPIRDCCLWYSAVYDSILKVPIGETFSSPTPSTTSILYYIHLLLVVYYWYTIEISHSVYVYSLLLYSDRERLHQISHTTLLIDLQIPPYSPSTTHTPFSSLSIYYHHLYYYSHYTI